jgi:hypothetical protein
VFELLAHSPFGFWAIALLIIIFDSSLLLKPGLVTYFVGKRLNVTLRIIEDPYLMKGKEPIISLFTYPLTPFFLSSIDCPSQSRQSVKRLLLKHKRITNNSWHLSNVALSSLLLVCVIGPVTSVEYGIERALAVTLPLAYGLALLAAIILYLNRSVYNLGRGDLALIGLELALCPVLIVNIFKKIAARQELTCVNDLVNYFSKDRAELARRLDLYVEATEQ